MARRADRLDDVYGFYVEKEYIGKRVKGSKAKVTWKLAWKPDLKMHEVELKHSMVTHKHEIKVDNRLLVSRKRVFEGEFSHEFSLGGHVLRVTVRDEVEGHVYDLKVDGCPFHRLNRISAENLDSLRKAAKLEASQLSDVKRVAFDDFVKSGSNDAGKGAGAATTKAAGRGAADSDSSDSSDSDDEKASKAKTATPYSATAAAAAAAAASTSSASSASRGASAQFNPFYGGSDSQVSGLADGLNNLNFNSSGNGSSHASATPAAGVTLGSSWSTPSAYGQPSTYSSPYGLTSSSSSSSSSTPPPSQPSAYSSSLNPFDGLVGGPAAGSNQYDYSGAPSTYSSQPSSGGPSNWGQPASTADLGTSSSYAGGGPSPYETSAAPTSSYGGTDYSLSSGPYGDAALSRSSSTGSTSAGSQYGFPSSGNEYGVPSGGQYGGPGSGPYGAPNSSSSAGPYGAPTSSTSTGAGLYGSTAAPLPQNWSNSSQRSLTGPGSHSYDYGSGTSTPPPAAVAPPPATQYGGPPGVAHPSAPPGQRAFHDISGPSAPGYSSSFEQQHQQYAPADYAAPQPAANGYSGQQPPYSVPPATQPPYQY